MAPLLSEDYTCPICLELLLRPVVLSCDHRFCRGCWINVLQSRDARATAALTGSASCPFRCAVKPIVPKVDQALASEIETNFDVEHRNRATSCSLPDEDRRSSEVHPPSSILCRASAKSLCLRLRLRLRLRLSLRLRLHLG